MLLVGTVYRTLDASRINFALGPIAFGAEQKMVVSNRRKSDRVIFERGIDAHVMGIDGTWRRDCTMVDVSQTGTKLTIHGSIEGLHLKEFFLLLPSTGLAYRRCELAWINGDQIGAKFVTRPEKKKQGRVGD